MKKVLLLVAVILGTSIMASAQTEPAKAAPAKEVRAAQHAKKAEKNAAKAQKNATAAKVEVKSAKAEAKAARK